MDRNESDAADWKDASAYAPLLEADRSILAWEWLRRDPGYRAAATSARGQDGRSAGDRRAARWGLHAFEWPQSTAPWARPVWRADVHPSVLEAAATAADRSNDAFDLARFASHATIVAGRDGGEHLLISDGMHAIRLDVQGRSLESGPVLLRYRLAGLASAGPPLLTLRRLLALSRTGSFSRSLHPPEARGRRWVLMLRAHDALAAGMGQREIAEALLSRSAGGARWRTEAPSLRLRAQRLVRAARTMAAGGYLALLRS